MKKILVIISFIICFSINIFAATKIFHSDSEQMYFYPEYSNSFNYPDGRKGYTVQIRRVYTVPQKGIKSIDLVIEFNSNWTQLRIMKWFSNDRNNQLVEWSTTEPQSWQNVTPGTVGGNIRDGVRKYFGN